MRNSELIKKPNSSIFDQRFPARLKEGEIYDPTKFTILTGSDGVLDDLFSYQVFNWLKNNWRAAAAPADKQPGMLFSDSDDDKLHHYGAAAWEEVLQLTRSNDVSPQFATVRLMDTGADHYLDLKCNEDLGAHRLLNLILGDAARTITLSGNPTLSDWFDQAVKQASSPTFNSPSLTTCAISGKLTIGSAVAVPSSMFDVRAAGAGAYIASFEQDEATGWGVIIDMDSADSGDPALYIKNPTINLFSVSSDGMVTMGAAASTITGGTALYIEAGVDGVRSNTIQDDTTVSEVNVRITTTATKLLMRVTSAKKYKDKIKDIELDTSKIYNLRPVSFNSLCKNDDKQKRFVGLIADEVEQIYPEIIDYNENNEAESYDNKMLMALMLAEEQKHEAKIKAIEARLEALEGA